MKVTIERVPYSSFYWYWLRQWQRESDISDADLATCLKVSLRTLKAYDSTPHNFNLDRLDNLVSAFGTEPLIYIMNNSIPSYNHTKNGYQADSSAATFLTKMNSFPFDGGLCSFMR